MVPSAVEKRFNPGNMYFCPSKDFFSVKKILVIQQKMIGDVLLSSILCEWIKKHVPESEVHYCIHANTLPVVQNNPFIDQVVLFNPKKQKNKKAFWKFLKQIRREHYDTVIDAYGKTESNLIAWSSRAPKRISYKKWYSRFFYTETVTRKPIVYTNAGNALEDRLRLVVPEDAIAENILKPKIYLTESERQEAKKRLVSDGIDGNKPLIMIGILGSAQNKSLPHKTMAQLIDATIAQTHGQLIFNFIPSQKEEVLQIYKLIDHSKKSHVFLGTYGKGLREFLGLLSHCSMLIGNEGGAVNMAKALNIPTFTVFSPWIHKKAWNLFEDGKHHVAVHLSDFEPERYQNASMKVFKKQSDTLYQKLTFNRIQPYLKKFISGILKS